MVWGIAAGVVAPGGRLVVVGHDSDNLTRGYGGPQRPEYLYTADDVVAGLPAGLTVRRAEQVIRPVETEDGMREAIDNLVVADRA
jgi:hypothetical protein